MAERVVLPKQGLQMTEGIITKWFKRQGDRIEAETPLFEMETDKVAMEIVAPSSGILLKILRDEGEAVPVAETVAIIGEIGEDISDMFEDNKVLTETSEPQSENIVTIPVSEVKTSEGRIFSTPRARTVALKNKLDISKVTGTGPDGLIIEKDVIGAIQHDKDEKAREEKREEGKGEIIPFTGMRRAIAENMMKSVHGMAQASLKIKVDMTEMIKMRENMKEGGIKVSYTDIIVKLVSRILLDFPIMNSTLTDEGILLRDHVNMGIAVALEKGLIVPVIKNTHCMSLENISKVSSELIEKAKTGKLKLEEYVDGTFTVTNLGMFDIDEFTAIINPHQCAILAVGKIDKAPVVEDDRIVIKPVMVLSLTYDHRITDGAPAAYFLQRVKLMMQNPFLSLI